MMNSKEAAREILRRRERLLKHRRRNKKTLVVICTLFVILSTGFGIGALVRSGANGQNDGLTESKDSLPDKYPSDLQPGDPSEVLFRFTDLPDEFFLSDTSTHPSELPVYVTNAENGEDSKKLQEYSKRELYEYIKTVYGEEEFDEKNGSGGWYFTSDPYVAVHSNGKRTILTEESRGISLRLDITAVEEFRDMSYGEALGYVRSTVYYKAGLTYLGLTDVATCGVAYDSAKYEGSYGYKFTFSAPSETAEESMTKLMREHIVAEIDFLKEDGRNSIELRYTVNRAVDAGECQRLTEYGTYRLTSLDKAKREALENVPYEVDESRVKTSLTYLKCTLSEADDSICYVPCYRFYVPHDNGMGDISYSMSLVECAVDGIVLDSIDYGVM